MIVKESQGPSKWTWQTFLQQPIAIVIGVSLIFGLLFVNEANFRQTTAMEAGADWQALMKLGISGACGAYGLWFLNFSRLKELSVPATGMALFCVWAYVCAMKSVNVVYSLTCCTTMMSVFVFTDAITQKMGRQRIILVSLTVLVLFLVGCWCANVVAPGLNSFDPLVDAIADSRRFAGLLHPNGTAGLAAMSIGLALVAANAGYLSWKQATPLMLFAFVTLFLTGSRTWMFAAILVSGYAALKHLNALNRVMAISAGVVVIALASFYLSEAWSSSKADKALASVSRSGKSEEIYTLTGRADLWAFCIKKIESSPVFGYGYGCQRFIIADEHYWPTRHAHNVLLNATLGTGLVGGGILAVVLVYQIFRLFTDRNDFPDTILLLILVGGFSENPIFNPLPGALTFLFFASLHWRDEFRIGA